MITRRCRFAASSTLEADGAARTGSGLPDNVVADTGAAARIPIDSAAAATRIDVLDILEVLLLFGAASSMFKSLNGQFLVTKSAPLLTIVTCPSHEMEKFSAPALPEPTRRPAVSYQEQHGERFHG